MNRRVNPFTTTTISLALFFCALQWFGATATEDRIPQPKHGADEVAIIDIGKVFEEYDVFEKGMDKLKNDVEKFEKELREGNAQIRKMIDQLEPLEIGTEARSTIEREVVQRQAKLQADTQLKRREFINQEAKLYAATYDEIQKEVAFFARANKIDLVIRYSSKPIDKKDSKSILQGVNATVVFQNQVDITSEILELLHSKGKIEIN